MRQLSVSDCHVSDCCASDGRVCGSVEEAFHMLAALSGFGASPGLISGCALPGHSPDSTLHVRKVSLTNRLHATRILHPSTSPFFMMRFK